MEKMTKKTVYEKLLTFANGGDLGMDLEALATFAKNEIDLLDKKAAKAKERAAAKKAEQDELGEIVKSLLTDEWQTVNDIFAQIEGEDVSPSKITARMTKLINAGFAIKEQVSVPGVDGGKATKKMGYRLAQ